MIIEILILVLVGAVADLARGESYKLLAALILGSVFGDFILINTSSPFHAAVGGLTSAAGFYLAAITTPRPLFALLHGKINPDEWSITPFNHWMYSVAMKFSLPITEGKKFGFIYGLCRGLYCLPATILMAVMFVNPLIAPLGILGSLQSPCYWLAGKLLKNNPYNAPLARILFGSVQGLILGLIILLIN